MTRLQRFWILWHVALGRHVFVHPGRRAYIAVWGRGYDVRQIEIRFATWTHIHAGNSDCRAKLKGLHR